MELFNKKIEVLTRKKVFEVIKKSNIKIDFKDLKNIASSLNFLIEECFLFGISRFENKEKVEENNKYFFMVWTINIKDNSNIYSRTKIKIINHFIKNILKNKPVISYTNIIDIKAKRFNKIIFKYNLDNIILDNKNINIHTNNKYYYKLLKG